MEKKKTRKNKERRSNLTYRPNEIDHIVYLNGLQVQNLLKCSRSNAYRIIKELNERRNKIGNLVIDGKVSEQDFNDYCKAGQSLSRLPAEGIKIPDVLSTVDFPDKAVEITAGLNNIQYELNQLITDQTVLSKLKRLKKNLYQSANDVYNKNKISYFSKLKSVPGKSTDKELSKLGGNLIELGVLIDTYKNMEQAPEFLKSSLNDLSDKINDFLILLIPYNTVE